MVYYRLGDIRMIVYRLDKGAPLTMAELENNFEELIATKDKLFNISGTTIDPLAGTHYDGKKLLIRIPGIQPAEAIAWDPIYRGIGFNLPTMTRAYPLFI